MNQLLEVLKRALIQEVEKEEALLPNLSTLISAQIPDSVTLAKMFSRKGNLKNLLNQL